MAESFRSQESPHRIYESDVFTIPGGASEEAVRFVVVRTKGGLYGIFPSSESAGTLGMYRFNCEPQTFEDKESAIRRVDELSRIASSGDWEGFRK